MCLHAGEASDCLDLAAKTWTAIKRSSKAGPRRTVRGTMWCCFVEHFIMADLCMHPQSHAQLPSVEEITGQLKGRRSTAIVFFLDETFEEVSYDLTTTVLEAVEQLANTIKLPDFQTFTLFEARKVCKGCVWSRV